MNVRRLAGPSRGVRAVFDRGHPVSVGHHGSKDKFRQWRGRQSSAPVSDAGVRDHPPLFENAYLGHWVVPKAGQTLCRAQLESVLSGPAPSCNVLRAWPACPWKLCRRTSALMTAKDGSVRGTSESVAAEALFSLSYSGGLHGTHVRDEPRQNQIACTRSRIGRWNWMARIKLYSTCRLSRGAERERGPPFWRDLTNFVNQSGEIGRRPTANSKISGRAGWKRSAHHWKYPEAAWRKGGPIRPSVELFGVGRFCANYSRAGRPRPQDDFTSGRTTLRKPYSVSKGSLRRSCRGKHSRGGLVSSLTKRRVGGGAQFHEIATPCGWGPHKNCAAAHLFPYIGGQEIRGAHGRARRQHVEDR